MKRLILTGTPAPNHYGDLHAQAYIVDNGESLGSTATYFRNRYMRKGGFQGKQWMFNDSQTEHIEDAIRHMILTMRAEDHLDMPELVVHDIYVQLPPDITRAYREIERKLFADLANGDTLTASGASAKYILCKQIANGGAYAKDDFAEAVTDDDGQRIALHVHGAKVGAVADLVDELQGKPLLVAYQYKHDLARLRERFGKDVPAINGEADGKETAATCRRWNAGKLSLLFAQPQACSHGINLQQGGNDVAWFGLTDSLEVYDQFNRRIYRQGVSGQVRVHRILAADTVDEAVRDRIEGKGERMEKLLQNLKLKRGKHETV